MRVVSLLPAATEWLTAFGATDLLVGRSHACDSGAEVERVQVLTRSSFRPQSDSAAAIDRAVQEVQASGQPVVEVDVERLVALAPDVVVTQDQCAVCAASSRDVSALLAEQTDVEVMSFAPSTFKEALDAALRLARRVGRFKEGMAVLADRERRLHALRQRIGARRDGSVEGRPVPTMACVEWTEPLMLAGHWVPDLVRQAGGRPVGPEGGAASPVVRPEALAALDPDVIVVAACGRTVEQARRDLAELSWAPTWRALRAVEERRVWICDGDTYFNGPGPRLYRAVELLAAVLHPQAAGVTVQPWELSPAERVEAA